MDHSKGTKDTKDTKAFPTQRVECDRDMNSEHSAPDSSTRYETSGTNTRHPNHPLVGVIMGSKSDWDTMQKAADVLAEFGVEHEAQVVSAHRTPAWMAEYGTTAAGRGLEVIIAGAGGAAHLPGMIASHTILPVIGVPVQSAALNGLDSLLSIVQMPKGIPVATVAIGPAGAANAGLLAVAILATSRPQLREKLEAYRAKQTTEVRNQRL